MAWLPTFYLRQKCVLFPINKIIVIIVLGILPGADLWPYRQILVNIPQHLLFQYLFSRLRVKLCTSDFFLFENIIFPIKK